MLALYRAAPQPHEPDRAIVRTSAALSRLQVGYVAETLLRTRPVGYSDAVSLANRDESERGFIAKPCSSPGIVNGYFNENSKNPLG